MAFWILDPGSVGLFLACSPAFFYESGFIAFSALSPSTIFLA